MTGGVFRFSFCSDVPLHEAEMTLHLAIFAAEGLFGTARTRLDFGYIPDVAQHSLLVDGSQLVGASIVRMYVGLLLREFGEGMFRVHRVGRPTAQLQDLPT